MRYDIKVFNMSMKEEIYGLPNPWQDNFQLVNQTYGQNKERNRSINDNS